MGFLRKRYRGSYTRRYPNLRSVVGDLGYEVGVYFLTWPPRLPLVPTAVCGPGSNVFKLSQIQVVPSRVQFESCPRSMERLSSAACLCSSWVRARALYATYTYLFSSEYSSLSSRNHSVCFTVVVHAVAELSAPLFLFLLPNFDCHFP